MGSAGLPGRDRPGQLQPFQLARELAGKLKLVKVNVDEAPKLQQRFTVQAIPTLMVLREGKVIARQAGAMPLPALRDWVQAALIQGQQG